MILSSLAKDSQAAFYQADTASDCAMYVDLVLSKNNTFSSTPMPFSCGVSDFNNLLITQTDPVKGSYKIEPIQSIIDAGDSCFRISVDKNPTTNADGVNIIETSIKAKGYNTCDLSSPRAVEREIDTNYNL